MYSECTFFCPQGVYQSAVAIVELIALIIASDSYYVFGARLFVEATPKRQTVSFPILNKTISVPSTEAINKSARKKRLAVLINVTNF